MKEAFGALRSPFEERKSAPAYEDATLPQTEQRTVKETDATIPQHVKEAPAISFGLEKTELFANALTQPKAKVERAEQEVSGVREKRPRSQKERFSLESTGKEMALKYAPEYLGAGGENIVYDIPGRPDVVVKGSKYGLYESLAGDPESVKAESVEDSILLMDMQDDLKMEAVTRKKLVQHFGREHVPPQKKFLMKVPVNEDILSEAYRFGPIALDVDEAWTVVTVQRKQELPKGKYVSASIGNLEPNILLFRKPGDDQYKLYKDQKYMEEYGRVSDALVNGKDEDITVEQITDVIRSPGLASVANRAKEDPEFREALKDYVEKAISFAEETGEIMDIVGADNTVFVKENGAWTYKLLDPIYPFDSQLLEKARKAYVAEQRSISDKEANALFQGINFVRGLNAFAKISGSEKRLEFLPSALMTKSVRETMKEVGKMF